MNSINKVIANLFFRKRVCPQILFSFASKNQGENESAFFQKNKLPLKPKISKEAKEETKSKIFDAYKEHQKGSQKFAEIESMSAQDVYKKMDSSMEGFFYKRKYNLFNFNYLLNVLAEQKNYDQGVKVLEKMKELNVIPNAKTYNYLIKLCAKTSKVNEAEKYFSEAKEKSMLDIHIYTSFMNCYTRKNLYIKAMKVFQEMKEIGIKPDIAVYTTLINAFYKGKDLTKCWELYNDALGNGIEIDENILGLMIEICAHTHDAEKAISLFSKLEYLNFREITLPYNAMIKALGSRTDYAQKGIDLFHTMLGKGIPPDQDTYVAALKACSNLGDVKNAYDIVLMLRNQGYEITKYIYNEMLRTYAGALSKEWVDADLKETYIIDSWKLLEQIKEEKKVSINILNSLLLVHCKGLKHEQVEGLVLPLYEQLNIKKDAFTYQHIIEMFSNLRDIPKVFRIYELLKKEDLKPTYMSLNNLLEIAIRVQNIDKLIELLKEFKKQKFEPKPLYLKRLGEAENLPDELYIELSEFKMKFGFVADKVFRIKKPNKYSRM